MHRPHRMAVVLLAGALMVSGCYGPFTLTKKVHHWNGQVSENKWVVEVVFLLCAWLPVYGIASLADAVIFNSVEFWTGKSMLTESASSGTPTIKRIVRKHSEAVLTRTQGPHGNELLIEQFQRGQLESSLRLRREGESIVAFNRNGAVLFRANTLPDGSVVITNAEGQKIASHSGDEVQQFMASLPQAQ